MIKIIIIIIKMHFIIDLKLLKIKTELMRSTISEKGKKFFNRKNTERKQRVGKRKEKKNVIKC